MSNALRAMGLGPNQRTLAHFWYVQTASYATPIPLVYGQNRVAASMIHMPSQPVKQSSGKFGKSGKANNYIAPVIFGICEGPITGINFVWADKNQPEQYSTGWIINQNNESDVIPGAPPYKNQVQFTSGGYGYFSDVSVYDATAGVFLTRIADNASPAPGAGQYQLTGTLDGWYWFNAAQAGHTVWITFFYHSQGTTFPGSWTLKLGTTPTQTVWSGLSSFPGQGVTYPGVAYLAHPSVTFPGDSPPQFSYEVQGLVQAGGGVLDANGADILTDFLTNALHGANFPASSLGQLSGFAGSYKNYCAAAGLFSSPVYSSQQAAHQHLAELFEVTNAGAYWSDGLLKVVPYGDTPLTANGFTYTPNTTPLYSLSDNDFLPNKAVASLGGADEKNAQLDPILITRKDPALIPNKIKVEYVSRAFDYNTDFIVAEDQISEALNGPLEMSPLSLRSVTVQSIARTVGQLRLQREQLITPISYSFVLGWKYSGLEPMDLVDLNDTNLGLVNTPVRLTQIEEMSDEQGFACVAEPWPIGTASAVLYPTPGGVGSRPTTNAIPAGTTGAFVIEGPTALISAPMELWIGAYGGAQWGGCQVWISTDNVTYQNVGTINGTAAFGTLQPSGLASAGGAVYPTVDTTNTGTVTIATGRQLLSLSTSDFTSLTYPCIILNNAGGNKEWMTYQTAALVTGTEYNISHLYRALYGTALASHVAAENWMMIDGSVAKIPWPNGVTGQTLYIKLPAFNTYGAQLEQLSAVSAFTYVIGGSPIIGAEPTLQVIAQVSSVVGNTTTIGVYVVDPAGTNESVSVTYNNVNFVSVLDVGTGLPLTSPFTVTANGAAKIIQLTPNLPFSGNCSLLFTATATNRTNGYTTFTTAPSLQNAEPSLTIAIATNTTTTTTTAKASAVVSGPSNAASIKWLASTSSQPSIASVIAGGTVVSAGAPVFTIADLGVALNLGDTVYVTVVYYDSGGSSQTSVQGQSTRSSINAQKTIVFTAGAFVAMVEPLGQAPNGTPYVTGSGSTGGVDVLSLTANAATAPSSTFVGYQLNFLLADNCTITSFAWEGQQTGNGTGFPPGLSTEAVFNISAAPSGTSMTAANVFAAGHTNNTGVFDGGTGPISCSKSTTGQRLLISAFLIAAQTDGPVAFRTVSITYVSNNTQASV